MTKLKKTIILTLIITINLINSENIYAQQNELNKIVLLNKHEYDIKSLLSFIIVDIGINLSYNNNLVKKNQTIKFNIKQYTVKQILTELAKQANIDYVVKDGIIVLKVKPKLSRFTVSGTVKDSQTGETIPYATIALKGGQNGTVSNKFGFYSLTIPEGEKEITFSYIGYQNQDIKLDINKNIEKNIELSPIEHGIKEVIVKSENSLETIDRRLTKLDMKTMKELPNAIGEPDLLRSMEFLPGVTNIAEIGGGLTVRGGGMDQNLILLDEAIVYNSSHMAGFFSVFNSDVIKDVKIYKGDIPANFGGRLSSVMDITQKEGNMRSFHANGSIGLISSKLGLEGPIIKDKASFNLSFRRSYVDMFFDYLPDKFYVDLAAVDINFYDINAKVNYKINNKNRIYLSAYQGHDILNFEDYNQEYGNMTSTLRYNHIFNSKLFSNTSIIYSKYEMIDGESDVEGLNDWEDLIGLEHYQLKNEFSYYLSKNKIKFGFDAIYRKFYPGELRRLNENDSKNDLKLPKQQALESAIHLSDQISIGKKIKLDLGIRYSMFHYLGDEEIFNYQPGVPRNINTITDTVNYKNNELIQFYDNIEPRINLKFELDERNFIKLSYNKTAQYIHLISNTITPSPYNMWKPCNNNIKPSVGQQFSLGYFTTLFKNTTDVSLEAFYRKDKNIIEVKPGGDIVLNRTLDADLVDGQGKAYGIELLISKKRGRNTSTLSYTYIRSLRKVDPLYLQERIYSYDYYPSDYDIPHKLSFLYTFNATPRTAFSVNFTFMSGRTLTLPDGQYIYFKTLMPYYSGKNQHRLPSFHRLNISYAVQSKKNKYRKWKGSWVFALYNVYARNNAYSIYIKGKRGASRNTEAIKYSILGSIVPSISYSFKF